MPVIKYQESYYIGVDIFYFFTSTRDSINFLEKEYNVDCIVLIDHLYKEALSMILVHRTGFRIYQNGDATRRQLIAKLGKNLNMKSIVLALMVALPVALVRQPYLIYLSLKLTGKNSSFSARKIVSRFKNLSFKDIFSKCRTLRHFIRT